MLMIIKSLLSLQKFKRIIMRCTNVVTIRSNQMACNINKAGIKKSFIQHIVSLKLITAWFHLSSANLKDQDLFDEKVKK